MSVKNSAHGDNCISNSLKPNPITFRCIEQLTLIGILKRNLDFSAPSGMNCLIAIDSHTATGASRATLQLMHGKIKTERY